MLHCGIHPLNLWITLWVSRLHRLQHRENARLCMVCLKFKHNIFHINQSLMTILRRCGVKRVVQRLVAALVDLSGTPQCVDGVGGMPGAGVLA
jgi:hypothetical protein